MNNEKIKQIMEKYLNSTKVILQLPFMSFVSKNIIENFENNIVSGKMLLEDYILLLSNQYTSTYFYTERGIEQIYNTYAVNMGAILSEDEKNEYYIMIDKEFKQTYNYDSKSIDTKSLIIDFAYRHVLRDILSYIKFQKVLHKQN